MVMAFVNQAAPGIRHKIQACKEEHPEAVNKKVYNNWETLEDKQMRVMALENTKYTWNMAWTPLLFTAGDTDERKHQLRCLARGQGKVLHCGMTQAAERPKCLLQGKGYWVKECPQKVQTKGLWHRHDSHCVLASKSGSLSDNERWESDLLPSQE